jgi:hypothetical protein
MNIDRQRIQRSLQTTEVVASIIAVTHANSQVKSRPEAALISG